MDTEVMLTSQEVAENVKAICDDNRIAFSTSEIASRFAPHVNRKELFARLRFLGNTDFPYVSKGQPEMRKRFGVIRQIIPNVWQCPGEPVPATFSGAPREKGNTFENRLNELEKRVSDLESR